MKRRNETSNQFTTFNCDPLFNPQTQNFAPNRNPMSFCFIHVRPSQCLNRSSRQSCPSQPWPNPLPPSLHRPRSPIFEQTVHKPYSIIPSTIHHIQRISSNAPIATVSYAIPPPPNVRYGPSIAWLIIHTRNGVNSGFPVCSPSHLIWFLRLR